MTELDDKVYTDELFNNIKSKFNLSDYEISLLKNINSELKKPLPTVQVGVESRLNVLDNYRVKLINLIYTVSDKSSLVEYNYKEEYDPEFTRLTRAGRPSAQAIDSEIHMNASMSDKRKLLNDFDSFKSLLYGYLKTIDSCKDTCIRKLNLL